MTFISRPLFNALFANEIRELWYLNVTHNHDFHGDLLQFTDALYTTHFHLLFHLN